MKSKDLIKYTIRTDLIAYEISYAFVVNYNLGSIGVIVTSNNNLWTIRNDLLQHLIAKL